MKRHGRKSLNTTKYSHLTKLFPEYQLAETKIEMPRFKRIFIIEYAHRVYGNAIGILFGVPMIYFMAKGYFKRSMILRMLGLLGIGATQGLIGWWMVKSGLRPKPAYQAEPRVSKTNEGICISAIRSSKHSNTYLHYAPMARAISGSNIARISMETSKHQRYA